MFLVCEKGTDVGLKHRGECKKGQCIACVSFKRSYSNILRRGGV